MMSDDRFPGAVAAPADDPISTPGAGAAPPTAVVVPRREAGRARALAVLVFILAAGLSAAALWRAELTRARMARQQASHLAQNHAQILRRNVDSMVFANHALAAMVRQGDGHIANFEPAATQLLLTNPGFLALSISPGGVVSDVVPRTGKEALVGLDLLGDPSRRAESTLSRDSQRLTLAGPLRLAQGGVGVVTRLPIFLDRGDGAQSFWGFSNVSIRLTELLNGVGLSSLEARGYHYVVWRLRAETGQRQVIAASGEQALVEPVRQSLEVPNGVWNIDLAPVYGWRDPRWLSVGAAVALLVSLLLAYVVKLLVEQRQHKSGLEALVQDRTQQILATRNQLKSTLDAIQDPLFELGLDGRVYSMRAPAHVMPEAFRGVNIEGRLVTEVLSEESGRVVMAALREAHAKGQARGVECALRLGRAVRWYELSVARKDDSAANEPRFVAVARDVTEHHTARQEIRRLAFYDPLTDLPNRRLLHDRLDHALKAAGRGRHVGALLLIDMDNFKSLNDTLGHDKGDILLQQVARRLTACVRESDTVARLGGDEFVVLVDKLGESSDEAARGASALASKIVEALGVPYDVAGHVHTSSTSIGVSLLGSDAATVEETLKRSDMAMYQAKAAGRNTLRFFDPAMQATVEARAVLESEMRRGLVQGEFKLHYQPQVDAGGRVVGVEALMRWSHPRRASVSPAEFIPIAEQSGLILSLGHWVLETACHQLVAWKSVPLTADLTLSVNVSVRQFRQPGFVNQVRDLLRATGADPGRLKIEITESMFAHDLEDIIQKMVAIQAEGVAFALDDFGTGYSSLSYLKRLPLDQLKIDQSFVRDVLTDPNDASIARTVVALARSLGLGVIAEGVETEGQRVFLAANGCELCQGYLFSRPLPEDALLAYLESVARRHAADELPAS